MSSKYKKVIPLSYQIRQRQLALAGVIRDTLMQQCYYDPDGPPGPFNTQSWVKDSQIIRENSNTHGANFAVAFQFTGFDPDESHWQYGPERVDNTSIFEHTENTLLLDNKQGVSIEHVERDVTVSEHEATSTETDDTISIDIGSKLKGTIGGEAAGGTIEAEISANLGITHGVKDIKSRSKDRSTTVKVSYDVPIGAAVLAIFSSPRITRSTPFTVVGVIDGPFTVSFDDGLAVGYLNQLMKGPRYSFSGGRHSISFKSFSDLFEALDGVNVDFPKLSGPLWPDDIDKIDAQRVINWKGTLHSVSDESATVRYEKVADPSEAAVQNAISQDRVIQLGPAPVLR